MTACRPKATQVTTASSGVRPGGGTKSVALLSVCVLLLVTAASAQDGMRPPRIVGEATRGRTAQSRGDRVNRSLSFGPLHIVAELPPVLYGQIAFGDTDHDGWNEIVFYVNDDLVFKYWIMEEQGNNTYTLEYEGPPLVPYATGDLDGDGKSEIIGQRSYQIQVYESADASSYPTQLVWSSPPMSNIIGGATVGDTDRDGKMEIIHSINGPSYLIIFENTGDDTYEEVFSAYTVWQDESEKVVADLDGDGLIEIAFCGSSGVVSVFESPADNQWSLTWRDSTGLWNAYGVEGGLDTDGNGVPELFVMGNPQGGGWTTIVYEAAGDNLFQVVDKFTHYDGALGTATNALGDLDGKDPPEYVMRVVNQILIYRSEQPGSWSLIGSFPDPEDYGHHGLQAADVNQNGVDEIFWDGFGAIQSICFTVVLEHPLLPSDLGTRWEPGVRHLIVSPNPCREFALVRLRTAAREAASLVVFDAAGRIVDRRPLLPEGSALWRPQASGTYFLRIDTARGESVASGRAVVIR